MKPISTMLEAYNRQHTLRMHMPAHRGRIKLLPGHDITEIYCSDNLASPSGAILRAEQLLAQGVAERAFMLTCGSSQGVRSMLLAAKAAGCRRLLADRACHRSVLDGCALAGLDCTFIDDADVGSGDALLLTSPDYYGNLIPAEVISAYKKRGATVLMDCAHGAHLPYIGLTPAADAWVASFHKTLGALTMGAVVYSRSEALTAQLERLIPCTGTSSPSYLVMESIDICRERAENYRWQSLLDRIARLRKSINNLGLKTACGDPLHFTVDFSDVCGGFNAQKQLIAMGIVPEMADDRRVMFLLSPFDRSYARLIKGIKRVKPAPFTPLPTLPSRAERVMPIREAVLSRCEKVPLTQAAGRICGASAGLYPPGIPAVCPGERITAELCEYLMLCGREGECFGTDGGIFVLADKI